jgi:hypothetical protein
MFNLGYVICYIYLLGKSMNSIKAEVSQSASTVDLTDCLSTVQHSKHQYFDEVGQKIKKI